MRMGHTCLHGLHAHSMARCNAHPVLNLVSETPIPATLNLHWLVCQGPGSRHVPWRLGTQTGKGLLHVPHVQVCLLMLV
eukprot:SAG31_NODE_4952_length_2837_cov_3.879474_4_plen_79_part_00